VHKGVDNTENKYEHPRQLVEINVLVEWKNYAEASCPEEGDALAQHQHQHKHAVKVQALA